MSERLEVTMRIETVPNSAPYERLWKWLLAPQKSENADDLDSTTDAQGNHSVFHVVEDTNAA